MIFLSISDPSAILKIEKAITSGTALVLYNIDRDVDSLFIPVIYHITTATSDEIEEGAVTYMSFFMSLKAFMISGEKMM